MVAAPRARSPRRTLLVALLGSVAALLAAAPGAAAHHYDHLLAPASACGGSDQTNVNTPLSEQQQAMTCLHNYARRKAGRNNVAPHVDLRTSSRRKSSDMLRCQELSHEPCGDDIWRRIRETGYMRGCHGVAENIAYGTGTLGNARSRMRNWLHSDVHRPNILNSRFRDIGIGVTEGTFQGRSGAQIWTAHFGYHC